MTDEGQTESSRVVWFEMSAVHPERFFAFYGDVFGWRFTKWNAPEELWLIATGAQGEPGIDGAVRQRRSPPATPASLTMVSIGVASIDGAIGRILGAGGEVVSGKTLLQGVGYVATCSDPEGNRFGLLQRVIAER